MKGQEKSNINKEKTKKSVKQKETKGYIEYYGLQELWHNELTPQEREEVKVRYEKGLNTGRKAVDEIGIEISDMLIESFILLMAEGVSSPETKMMLIRKSEELGSKNSLRYLDDHIITMTKWKVIKKIVRENKELYPMLIEYLKYDCSIYDEYMLDYLRWSNGIGIKEENRVKVSYPAFKELALAYERTREYKKAIEISKLAIEKDVKEETSFERRISKLEKRVQQ